MINEEELKIGNYCIISDKEDTRPLHKKAIKIPSGHVLDSWELEPLPITPKTLGLFEGFKTRPINGGIYTEYYIDCTPPKYRDVYVLGFCFSEGSNVPFKSFWHAWSKSGVSHGFPLEAIHQVQNLYESLTGKKMVLK